MASIDVSVSDILWGLDSRDQEEMLEGLLDQMDIAKVLKIIKNHEDYGEAANKLKGTIVLDDDKFASSCAMIANNRWRLTLDQEQLILQIADKL